VAIAIEVISDLSKLKLEDDEPPLARVDGKLYLTEEQWEVHRRQHHGKERTRGDDARRAGRSGGHDEDDDDASTCSGFSRRSECRNRGRCFNCNERGHITKFCPQVRGGKALMADVDEDPTLL
jgi:hypothetical protein